MNLREKQMELSHLLEAVAEKFRGLLLPRVIGDYHLRLPPDDTLRSRIVELGQLIGVRIDMRLLFACAGSLRMHAG